MNPTRRFFTCTAHRQLLARPERIPGLPTLEEITGGIGFTVQEQLPELADEQHPGGRSLHDAWHMGDRVVVLDWLATVNERRAAEDEHRRTDPELVRLRELAATDRFPDVAQRFAEDPDRPK